MASLMLSHSICARARLLRRRFGNACVATRPPIRARIMTAIMISSREKPAWLETCGRVDELGSVMAVIRFSDRNTVGATLYVRTARKTRAFRRARVSVSSAAPTSFPGHGSRREEGGDDR